VSLGFDGVSRLSAVERYDPRVGGDWEILKDMSSLRSNFTAVELDDMIFVIGGKFLAILGSLRLIGDGTGGRLYGNNGQLLVFLK